jgi:hypothetical protein
MFIYMYVCCITALFLNKHFIALIFLSMRMRWAGHVARIGDMRNACRVLVGKPQTRDHYEDPDIVGRVILRWILEKCDRVVWTGYIWLRIGTSGGLL